MSTIPFIEARFFDPSESRFELENRLRRHLRLLRCKKLPPSALMPPDDALDDIDNFDPNLMGIIGITSDDDARIKRRVKRFQEQRKAASGLEHLKSDDRSRLEALKDGARLVSIPSEHRADELAAALHEDMPWMALATEAVWQAMRADRFEKVGLGFVCLLCCSTVRQASAKAIGRAVLVKCRERVGPDDDLWILGDFSAGKATDAQRREVRSIFHALPGRRHLIKGNHDVPWVRELPWDSMADTADIVVDGRRLYLCHYPMITWPGARRNGLQLFGHVHQHWQGSRNSVNVGVDVWDYRPVALPEIVRRAATLQVNAHWHQVEPRSTL